MFFFPHLKMAFFYKSFRLSSYIKPCTFTVRRSSVFTSVQRYRKLYSTYNNSNTMTQINVSNKSGEQKWWKEAIVYQVGLPVS